MNVHKHMEAIFVATLAIVGVSTWVIDSVPEATASQDAPVMRDVPKPGATAIADCAPVAPRHA